ncbi:hypothetical protein RYX36_028545 [Vicia faba]
MARLSQMLDWNYNIIALFICIFSRYSWQHRHGLLDVMGILSSVGRERVYERNRVATKFKVIELESNGLYVYALDAFLQFGCNENIVVLARYLKVKLYNGKVQLQNAMNCIKLLFSPEIPEAESLKLHDNIGSPTQPFSYMKDASELSLEEECLNLSQCKTIEELKDCQDDVQPTILPIVIGELVEKTMLFKIVMNNDVNSGFEQSFRVKKLCLYQNINFGGVEDDLAVVVVHYDINAGVVQDLDIKFENIATEEKYGDNGSASKHI